MSRVISILVVLAVALAITAGCGKVVEKAVEKATGVEVDKNGESVTIKGKDGDTTTISSKVPDELKNFPVPSGFQIKDGGTMSQGGDKLSVASWNGKSSVDKVVEFYKSAMPGQGWKEESAFTSGDTAMLSYTKDPDQSVTITVGGKSGGEIEISVLLGKSSQKATPAAQPTRASGTTPTSGSSSTAGATPTPAKSQASPTPAGPATVDSSTLPDELKSLPVPSGFKVVKGSTSRSTSGGKFASATAVWYGKGSAKVIGNAYKSALVDKGWIENSFDIGDDYALGDFDSKDGSLNLWVNIGEGDGGIYLQVELVKY